MSHKSNSRAWRQRCRPAQIIFSGTPSRFIECPACKQRFEGIPYPFGRNLYTLPHHQPEEEHGIHPLRAPERRNAEGDR